MADEFGKGLGRGLGRGMGVMIGIAIGIVILCGACWLISTAVGG